MENVSVKRIRDISRNDANSGSLKRKRFNKQSSYDDTSSSWRLQMEQSRNYSLSSAPSSLNGNNLNMEKYGGLTKEIKALIARRSQLLEHLCAQNPTLPYMFSAVEIGVASVTTGPANDEVIDLTDEQDKSTVAINPVIIIDSDDDDNNEVSKKSSDPFPGVNSEKPSSNLTQEDLAVTNTISDNCAPPVVEIENQQSNLLLKDFVAGDSRPLHLDIKLVKPITDLSREVKETCLGQIESPAEDDSSIPSGPCGNDREEDKGVYVGTGEESDEVSDTNSDGLGDIWSEMNVALESSKDPTEALFDEGGAESDNDCEHSFILKDDIGDVCRICGVIKRGIEKIIEYNFSKAKKSTRTYANEERTNTRELNQTDAFSLKRPIDDLYVGDITPHPRHGEMMKSHQVEGFKFLESNLITDNPGGCIMAHAPGSGKTFMMISFLQSFMSKYPAARPLVVLPKGLLGIWKTEFMRWQVEDIPLYDFYSAKADNRSQQLDLLQKWVKDRSILFLGYQQFTNIMTNDNDDEGVTAACQDYLLKVPTILIIDEGHTPRNKETNMLNSLSKVETPRKVVLSGTLYQNNVEEIFNILDLVRPRFLKMETSKAIKRRILSRVEITRKRSLRKHGKEFYDLIEHALTKDENHARKMMVIQDLREMTRHVLHYYKGDNLGELPGLVDFSLFLRLRQKAEENMKVLKAKTSNRFSLTSEANRISLHPLLKNKVEDENIDALLQNFNIREGAKASFYINLLKFCASSGEKLLVFSQYVWPLTFLVRMTSKLMGYTLDREMFMITGDSACGDRDASMEKFNTSPEAQVFFGSIKACGEGISLVGASRVVMLDIHLNPSVTRQALGRAYRPGQVRMVYVYRLVASGSPEEDDYATCCRKESISKLWFEWDQSSVRQIPEMEKVDVNRCGDVFLETVQSNEDIVALFKR